MHLFPALQPINLSVMIKEGVIAILVQLILSTLIYSKTTVTMLMQGALPVDNFSSNVIPPTLSHGCALTLIRSVMEQWTAQIEEMKETNTVVMV